MKYLVMIYANEDVEAKTAPAETAKLLQAYGAYMGALSQAGVLLASQRLRPTSEATSVRVKNGKNEVLNGPFAEHA